MQCVGRRGGRGSGKLPKTGVSADSGKQLRQEAAMEKQLKNEHTHTYIHMCVCNTCIISLRLAGTVQKYAPHTKMWNTTTVTTARNGNKNNNNNNNKRTREFQRFGAAHSTHMAGQATIYIKHAKPVFGIF